MEVEPKEGKRCFVLQSRMIIVDKIDPQFLSTIDINRIVMKGATNVISFNVDIKFIDGHFVVHMHSDYTGFETFFLIFKTAEDINDFIDTFKYEKKRYTRHALTFFFNIDASVADFYFNRFDFLPAEQIAAEKHLRELRAQHAASIQSAPSSSSSLPTMIGNTEVY